MSELHRSARHMKPILAFVLSLTIFLVGCVSRDSVVSHGASEASLVGFWFTSDRDQYPGYDLQSVCEKRSDGTFRIRFAKVPNEGGPVEMWEEEGTWTSSQGMIVTVTTVSDGEPCDTSMPYYHDTYVIESLSSDRYAYVHAGNGIRWEAMRVDSSFTIPSGKYGGPNQALQTTPMTRSVYEKTTEFGHPHRGV